MNKYKTESFNVDHTTMQAPQVRQAGRYSMNGVVVSKLDIRFCAPNKDILTRRATHTIEHLFAEAAHSKNERIIDFSPMGCGTGFYLTFFGEPEGMKEFILETFAQCLEIEEIPALNPIQCGNYTLHDLEEARKAIREFITYCK